MNASLRRSAIPFGSALLVGAALATSPQAQDDASGTAVQSVPAPKTAVLPAGQEPGVGETVAGEVVPRSAYGPYVIETMEEVMERDRKLPPGWQQNYRLRNGRQGVWEVPGRKATFFPHSGRHYATNKWGDTSMGIGFGRAVDLEGAWFAGQGGIGSWTTGVRVIGYLEGQQVATTDWFRDIDASPDWFSMSLENVDRVVIEAEDVINGAAWYGLDDLTFVPRPTDVEPSPARVVVDFDDAGYEFELTGSGHAGLTWETGTGEFDEPVESMPPPQNPIADAPPTTVVSTNFAGGLGTAPTLVSDFIGPRLGDTGANLIPPDTCGYVGIDHFVAVVNANISIYLKSTGQRVMNSSLGSFFNTGSFNGDPRVVFDPDSQRWFAITTNFSNTVWIAVSTTSNPTGSWFKTSWNVSQGADAGKSPDYPTLGVDENGVYVAAAMFGGNVTTTIFALDKAPLLAGSLGTITAFRSLNFEGAQQPCVQYGSAPGAYIVARRTSSSIRLRRINPPLAAPTLSNLSNISIPSHSSPPNAPAQGSGTPLDMTVGPWLMNAVYRNGSIWTTHAIGLSGRAAARWYEINPLNSTTNQVGTVSDNTRYYIYPSIAVNANGDCAMGMTGTHSGQFAGTYFCGRLATDQAGEMSVPAQYKAGEGSYNLIDGFGRNRWGDYSLTSSDPTNGNLWTIQEYARSGNSWGTWIAELEYMGGPGCGLIQNYCVTSPNSVGPGSVISTFGSVSVATNNFGLVATGNPPGQNGLFFYGNAQAQNPVGNGFMCIGGNLFRLPVVQADNLGVATHTLDLTNPPLPQGQIMANDTWNFAFWYRDPTEPPAGFDFSDGVSVTFCP